jgi:predicted O-methyltransferase YrrM
MRRHRLQHNAEERAAPAGASRHGLGLVADVQVSDHRRMEDRWRAVDAYVEELLGTSDEVLEAALADMVSAGMPAISVSPAQGKFLHLLTRAVGASRVLEVGTLGGYSTIWLGRAVAPGGRVVTLEISPRHAEVARVNLARAGLADLVDVRVGPAADSLALLDDDFDLVFIDADKPSNADYVRAALRVTHPGSVIVIDNVVRAGAVVDPQADQDAHGARRLHQMLAAEPRLAATTIQTVGAKGHDGFTMALVLGDGPSTGLVT